MAPFSQKLEPPANPVRFSTHTCEEWEITSYKNDVDNYIRKLQDYVDESFEAARKAARLAEEAQDYAKCEAADIARQY